MNTDALDRKGVGAAVGAYALWGLFPAFWPLLAPASPVEVLAHRILWAAVLMTAVLTVVRGWRELRALPARGWLMTTAAGLLVSANWGLYIYAVFAGHVVEAALGYFMSPLINVALGVLVLQERLRAAQWAAVVLGLAAVTVIAVASGSPPWIALALSVSFGIYGLIKRTVPLAAVPGITAETLAVGPLAVGVVCWLAATGVSTFTSAGPGHVLLMIIAGPVTAIPLLLFAFGARRIPFTTIGVLMYLNPIMQFLWGVLVVGERMPTARWVGFVLVWAALVIFTVDLVRSSRAAAPVGEDSPVPRVRMAGVPDSRTSTVEPQHPAAHHREAVRHREASTPPRGHRCAASERPTPP